MHSVLYSLIVFSHNAFVMAAPTLPTDGRSPASISVVMDRVAERVALTGPGNRRRAVTRVRRSNSLSQI
jgi:hypothetical protein